MSSTPTAHVTPLPRSAPLGPGSLTWKYLGDRRLILFTARTGTLQNMHPAVGAALDQHSNFFDNPWDRIFRSLPAILGAVYDPDAAATAAKVRDYHKDLKGSDSQGRRYHALNPDVYWWTHVTFIEAIIAMNDYFGTPFTAEQKDQVVREGVTWWLSYGLSTRPVLDTYADFHAYWNRMLDEELEANQTTTYALELGSTKIPPPPGVPASIWAAIGTPVMKANVWLLNAMMPERARETLGLQWSARDERRFRTFATALRLSWPLLPDRLRYYRRAYDGIKHAESQRH
ncbi:oxygenase MpaB family protein [Nocardia sp. NPDC059239]|uniref:oxygenase MpaB family protein n=1 Tax=unclassified Nocardia TaxID=2637762 RepID=UPI0036AAF537